MLSPERAAPSAVLRANSQAHLAKWGTDPCAEVTADRSPGVEISTAVTAGAGDPLQLRLPDGRWCLVHARDRPLDEARDWLATVAASDEPPAALCVIGAGAGWVVDAVEEWPAATRLLVLEPEPACVVALFSRRDLRALIDAGRLMVLCGPGYAGGAAAWRLFARISTDPPLLIHPVIGVAARASTVAAARLARAAIDGARANEHARRRFAAPYLLNTLRNVPSLATEADAGALTGLYAGLPVVIAGAGPSLNRNIEALAPYRDRVVLVAADTALRPLLAAGVEPDFVVAVDPSVANARHLADLPVGLRTALVAEASVQRATIEAFAGRCFLFRVARHHPWPWLHPSGLDIGVLAAWGSVLVTAFDLGVKLGGDPLITIGADLAFTAGQPYCRGTVYEEDWRRRVAAGESLATVWREAIALHPTVTERHGDDVVATAPHLVQFRDGLLNAARAARATVINATGAGIFRGDGVALQSIEVALRDVAPRAFGPPPRTIPSPAVADRLRQRTITLVHRLEPSPEGWGEVLAEHQPPDPTLGEQCEAVRVALARWAGVEP